MEYIFHLSRNIEHKTYIMDEDDGFKPIFYYLDNFSDWIYCQIYHDSKLIWKITNYGHRVHIVRFQDEKESMRCSLINRNLNGCAYLYSNGRMAYILKYLNNNLHGAQIRLDESYHVEAEHGSFIDSIRSTDENNKDIKKAHSLTLSLVKWI